jgi:hypothetical protein
VPAKKDEHHKKASAASKPKSSKKLPPPALSVESSDAGGGPAKRRWVCQRGSLVSSRGSEGVESRYQECELSLGGVVLSARAGLVCITVSALPVSTVWAHQRVCALVSRRWVRAVSKVFARDGPKEPGFVRAGHMADTMQVNSLRQRAVSLEDPIHRRTVICLARIGIRR